MYKILGHVQPIGGNREQGATQPDIVVNLYTAPTGTGDWDKASVDDVTIYCSNINQSGAVDYIGIRTHLKGEGSDDTEVAAICLYKEVKAGDVVKFDGIKLADGESIWVYSSMGHTNFAAYGDEVYGQDRIEELKQKVILGTATAGDKEKLMLLTGGAYVIQTNTNNCGGA